MSFISAIFKKDSSLDTTTTTQNEEKPIKKVVDSNEYNAFLYPINSDISIQTEDSLIYIVISNDIPVDAYTDENKAMEAVKTLTSSFVGEKVYKITNGKSIFIYSDNNLVKKIWYKPLTLK